MNPRWDDTGGIADESGLSRIWASICIITNADNYRIIQDDPHPPGDARVEEVVKSVRGPLRNAFLGLLLDERRKHLRSDGCRKGTCALFGLLRESPERRI